MGGLKATRDFLSQTAAFSIARLEEGAEKSYSKEAC
jgi:hypothetical protein